MWNGSYVYMQYCDHANLRSSLCVFPLQWCLHETDFFFEKLVVAELVKTFAKESRPKLHCSFHKFFQIRDNVQQSVVRWFLERGLDNTPPNPDVNVSPIALRSSLFIYAQIRSVSVGLHSQAVDMLCPRNEGFDCHCKSTNIVARRAHPDTRPFWYFGLYVRISKNAISLFLHSHFSIDL